jgi:hypothetical protein
MMGLSISFSSRKWMASAARVQTVPSIHAQRQAHGRVVRSSPGGLGHTEPHMYRRLGRTAEARSSRARS